MEVWLARLSSDPLITKIHVMYTVTVSSLLTPHSFPIPNYIIIDLVFSFITELLPGHGCLLKVGGLEQVSCSPFHVHIRAIQCRAVARNMKKGGLDCTRARRAAKIFGPRPLYLTTPIN